MIDGGCQLNTIRQSVVKKLEAVPKRRNVPRAIVFNKTKMVLYGLVSLEIRVKDTAGRIRRSRETFVSVGNAPKDVVLGMMYLEKHDPQRDYPKREFLWKDEVMKVPVPKQPKPPCYGPSSAMVDLLANY